MSSVSAGWDRTCALATSESVYCWGSNWAGQLGTGNQDYAATPLRALLPEPARSVALGGAFTCALAISGQVYCWGGNDFGELGRGTAGGFGGHIPATIAGGHIYQKITSGYYHSCGLRLSGEIDCWGLNSQGQLGNGDIHAGPGPHQVQF